ncbi:MAG: DNA repair exonuclease [Eubacteriales bacterium]
MLKIVHSGDIHLDTPFRRGGKERREAARESFRALITHIIDRRADIALLPGDIYDAEFVTADTSALLRSSFERACDTRFFISPGNHDPYTAASLWAKAEFPPNVHIFKSERPERVDFTASDGSGVSVVGWAFTSPLLEHAPAEEASALISDAQNAVRLLCAHCDVTKSASRYAPITPAQLADSRFDYAALGHIHNGGGLRREGGVSYAYSGALTPRDFGENGAGGALDIDIDSSGGKAEVAARFIRLSRVRYELLRLDIGGAASMSDILPAILREAERAGVERDTNVRVTLEGAVSPSFSPDAECVRAALSLDTLPEIDDRTSPTFDTSALEDDPTVRGAFYRALCPMLTSADEKTRRTAAAALRLGLSALAGADI